jgi:eukaryotic translation initiation factor 2C
MSLTQLHVGNGAEKRGMIMAAWKSRTLQEKLSFGKMWLFDGNKIAWYLEPLIELRLILTWCRCDSMPPGRGEMRLTIDMDAERGRAPRVDGRTGQVRQNTITVRMKQVGEINMAVIEAYLTKKIPFDNAVLEAISGSLAGMV